MSFQNSITNGETHWIARHLGVADPAEDPIGFGIGLVVVASRRLGHPITWTDAEQITNEETSAILTAAETLAAPATAAQRSEAVAALMASLPATSPAEAGDASPEPQRPETGPTPNGAPSAPPSPSTVASHPGTPNS